MAEGKKKFRCCIYLHSGSYDRFYQALSISNVVLAMGGEVHIFCSYGALKRLVKGNTDRVAMEGEACPLAAEMERSLERGAIDPIGEVLHTARRFGDFRLYACTASMQVLDLKREDLVDGVDSSMGLVEFQGLVAGADEVLYI